VYGSDVPYSEEALMLMHNADLADTFGNLVHRAANLCQRICGGCVPDVPVDVVFDVDGLRASTERLMASFALQQACEAAINAVKDTNKYLTDKAPWHMKDDERGKAVVVRSTLEAIYIASHFLSPYIPAATAAVFARCATPQRPICTLGQDFTHLQPGTAVQAGDVLFAKFEAAAEPAPAKPAPKAAPAADAPMDASRLEMRVGTILTVRAVPQCCTRLTRIAQHRSSRIPAQTTCMWRRSTWARLRLAPSSPPSASWLARTCWARASSASAT
jgi:methionyl-tRNA synthetase